MHQLAVLVKLYTVIDHFTVKLNAELKKDRTKKTLMRIASFIQSTYRFS